MFEKKKGLKLEPDGNLKEPDATRTIKRILDYELNRRSIEIQNKKLAEYGLNKNTFSETEKNLKTEKLIKNNLRSICFRS